MDVSVHLQLLLPVISPLSRWHHLAWVEMKCHCFVTHATEVRRENVFASNPENNANLTRKATDVKADAPMLVYLAQVNGASCACTQVLALTLRRVNDRCIKPVCVNDVSHVTTPAKHNSLILVKYHKAYRHYSFTVENRCKKWQYWRKL